MPKLHQILAVENGSRAQAEKDKTEIYRKLKKSELLEGQYNEYQPVKEDGEKLPTERQILQARAPELLKDLFELVERIFDLVATRDYGNMKTKADVILEDGTVLFKDAPTHFLIWVEKQLDDLHTVIAGLPILPPDIEWVYDENQNCYRNKQEVKTHKTAKIAYPLLLHPATDKHPAQVVEKVRDETVGYWTKIRYHGGLPADKVKAAKDRVEALQKAVKFAREKANEVEVEQKKVGGEILKYIFGNLI